MTPEFPVEESKTDKKKEMQNVTSLADPQSTDEEKEVKNKDAPIKGSVLKRKRKRLAQYTRSSLKVYVYIRHF